MRNHRLIVQHPTLCRKGKTKATKLEARIGVSDRLVQDYANDFEVRRDSQDKKDRERLAQSMRVYLKGKSIG